MLLGDIQRLIQDQTHKGLSKISEISQGYVHSESHKFMSVFWCQYNTMANSAIWD